MQCEQSEDSTWKIIRSYASSQNQTTDQPDQDFPSLIDIFRSHINDLSELPAAGDVQLGINNISPESFSTPATATSSNAINEISLTSESVFLLQTYVRTVATWMDCFDHSCTYQLKIPALVLKSPLLFHAVCAFTANHVALSNLAPGKSWKIIAARHYGEALTLLIDALSLPSHEYALTASMLLLSYEIHEAQQSDDYKSHFEGMAMLVQSRGVNAQSTGTDLANFWIYIRHDIVSAMAGERPLILDPADWAVSWKENEKREDVLGNQVLWILARVVNLVFGEDGRSDAGKAKRRDFLDELETWRSGLSETFVGIPYGDEDEDGFRKVYFPVIAAAAAAFWFGVTHILLMAEPTLQSESYVPLIQDQARRVINIAISDFPPALKVFSTHGLFYGMFPIMVLI